MHRSGFTLIELLITLAIVGILTSIAYPTYRHHIVKVRRAHATVLLMDLAAQLEQRYNENHSYEGTNDLLPEDKFYRFEVEAEENDYLIKAIPINAQTADTKCAILMLDHLGNKTITGTGTIMNCWP